MTKRYQTTLNDKQERPHFEELMDQTLIISRLTKEGPGYKTDLSLQNYPTMCEHIIYTYLPSPIVSGYAPPLSLS